MTRVLMGAILSGVLLAQTPVVSFTATTENVAGAGDSIRIDVLRWSTDAERDQLLAAWNVSAAPNPGRGAGTRAKGKAVEAAKPAEDEADVTDPFGAFNRAGRGGAKGGGNAAPQTPESSLATALGKTPTVGHLWSSEVSGYAVRYAARVAEQDGSERIVLVTDRRLGAWNDLWKPAGAASNYPFSVIELRLNSKGEGEGKASLTGKIVVDGAAKAIGLEGYGAVPVILKNVRRRN